MCCHNAVPSSCKECMNCCNGKLEIFIDNMGIKAANYQKNSKSIT